MGHGTKRERPEKVPKWSREQFDDKVNFNTTKMLLILPGHKHGQSKTKDVWSEFRKAVHMEVLTGLIKTWARSGKT
jgi:hypothetical protein